MEKKVLFCEASRMKCCGPVEMLESFKPTKILLVCMSALLLTPSELGVTCILSSKPWISLWFPLDFIGEVQWDFNSRLMISNFDWTYLRAQKEFEGVLTCKQEAFLLVWMIPTFLRARNTSLCSPQKKIKFFLIWQDCQGSGHPTFCGVSWAPS